MRIVQLSTKVAAGAIAAVVLLGAAPAGADSSVGRARARLDQARADATAAAQLYADAVGVLGNTEEEIGRLEHRIPRLERRIVELRGVLARQAALLYVGGGRTSLTVVEQFDAQSGVLEAARASELAGAAQEDLDARVDELHRKERDLDRDRADLRSLRRRQQEYTTAARGLAESLAAAVERAEQELRRAEQAAARRRWFAALAAQRAAQEAAAAAAAAAGTAPPPAPTPQPAPADPSLAGRIPVGALLCPVDGGVTFVDDWGNARSGWRVHQGTDMFAAAGTPNVAVAAGVASIQQGGLGGNAVWLRIDDGNEYYYAHLASFAGDYPGGSRRVEQGELIGTTGDTGNAAGGPPHTHFEIHPQGAGAVNPFSMLRDMCGA